MNQDLETPVDVEQSVAETPKPTFLGRCWGWTKFVIKLSAPIWLYLLVALIGLIPVNRDFRAASATDAGSVKIFVRSSDVHADILVPIKNDAVDWSDSFPVPENRRRSTYVSFGWGDRGFYLQTPSWGDLTVSKATNAMLLPSKSVMHVEWLNPHESDSCKSVLISEEQYRTLAKYIARSFQSGDTESDLAPASEETSLSIHVSPIPVDPQDIHDAWRDRGSSHFYEANGSYHAFHTCNCWVGNALKQVGIRTAWFTPLPRTVFVHWPEAAPDKSAPGD